MSYMAICTRLHNVRPHRNADRLKLATAHGYQVVVGLDAEEGQLGVFFSCDGQLSEEYAKANDLVSYKDENGNRCGGFFAKNRRVRSQNFRGEKSEGYFAPIESFEFTGTIPKEGDEFDSLNGIPICNKYYTPATQKAQGSRSRRENVYFAKHIDTKHLKKELHRIEKGDIAYVTEKLHGTSGRFGHVLELKKPTIWQKIVSWVRGPVKTYEYRYLLGTRNTILADKGFYGNENFRRRAVENLTLHEGEVLYFELVGYTDDRPIMGTHDTSNVPQYKKYGSKIVYSYGQLEGTCGMYVYRITQVNEKGHTIELPWCQVKARCDELGIKHCPEIMEPRIIDNVEDFIKDVDKIVEGPSLLCQDHPREGVVVRLEGKTTRFLKAKSFEFGLMEGYLKDNDNYVDLEEVS